LIAREASQSQEDAAKPLALMQTAFSELQTLKAGMDFQGSKVSAK